jgi:hypothetical protein
VERLRPGRLFAPDRLTLELLRCRPAWPPVQQQIFGSGTWLVVENWSTYDSLCTVAAGAAFPGRIIFGSGNQVGTRVAALADAGEAPRGPIAYFGDLDAGGIRAARLAATSARELGWPPAEPCRPLYALALSSPHRLVEPPASVESVGWTRAWFGGEPGDTIAACIRLVRCTSGAGALRAADAMAWIEGNGRRRN